MSKAGFQRISLFLVLLGDGSSKTQQQIAKNSCALFLIAFLNCPCYETPKKRDKKKSSKTTREKKNAGGGKHIFCDEPRWIFVIFCRVFELPFLRKAQKRDSFF
jgi:hypothetical protein